MITMIPEALHICPICEDDAVDQSQPFCKLCTLFREAITAEAEEQRLAELAKLHPELLEPRAMEEPAPTPLPRPFPAFVIVVAVVVLAAEVVHDHLITLLFDAMCKAVR